MDGIVIRNIVESDLNFIRSNWLRTLYEAPNGLPDEQWWPAHREYVEKQLFSDQNVVLIAAADDRPSEILGFIVAKPEERLEWLFVRKGLVRGKGLGRLLLEAARLPDPVPSRWRTKDSTSRLRVSWNPRELRKTPKSASLTPTATELS